MSKRVIAAALVLAITTFSGCSDETQGKTVSYDIPSPVTSLDPQFTTDPDAVMIIMNIFEGLLSASPDGVLSPGVAESYEVSGGGLVYTFHLRGDAGWAGGEFVPVTAEDFVFAFQRMFSPESPSPYAEDYMDIKNAAKVLSGHFSSRSLGVTAKDAQTLVITLERENPLFLEILATGAAMPCNKEAYENARGRYGLEQGFTASNGPFRVSRWTESGITLSRNANYASGREAVAGEVSILIGRKDAARQFLDGASDFAALPYSLTAEAAEAGAAILTAQKTTWCIVLNQNIKTWENPFLRQALAMSLDYAYLAERLPENLSVSNALIPSASVFGGRPFRSYESFKPPIEYDPANALRVFQIGLDMFEYDTLPAATLLVPDTGGHPLYMGVVQQGWQRSLSAYINIRAVPVSEIERRFASGDYELLLMPFSPAGPRPETILSTFTSASAQNRFGYKSQMYDQLFQSAFSMASADSMAAAFARAERMILSDAAVIPVYAETAYYASGKGVSGIEIQPFGNQIYFKYAYKT